VKGKGYVRREEGLVDGVNWIYEFLDSLAGVGLLYYYV